MSGTRKAPAPPSANAARIRLYRQRRRDGFALVAPVEVKTVEIDVLVRRGLLAPQDTRDRVQVALAIGDLLEQILGG